MTRAPDRAMSAVFRVTRVQPRAVAVAASSPEVLEIRDVPAEPVILRGALHRVLRVRRARAGPVRLRCAPRQRGPPPARLVIRPGGQLESLIQHVRLSVPIASR